VSTLPGISANVLRRLLIGSVAGFFGCLALAGLAAWLIFNGAAAGYRSASAVFVVSIVGVLVASVALTIFRIAYARRLEREVIHRTIQSGIVDMQQMPSMLIGRPVEESELIRIDSDGAHTSAPPKAQVGRPLGVWIALGFALLGSVFFLLRVAESHAAGDSNGAGLSALVGSTLLAVFIPSFVFWALGALRNLHIRRAVPHSLSMGSARTPPLEFGLAQIDPSTVDRVRYLLVWSFDTTGATL
jgi:hypothetical protein